MSTFISRKYQPPSWAESLKKVPKTRVDLAQLPTPLQFFNVPQTFIQNDSVKLYLKRDDLSGMLLSGNKVRKLEFLLPDAKEQGCDCVITLGGIQSNHCRTTALAARYLNLDTHLILRCNNEAQAQSPGFQGNLLVDRLVGAKLHLVTKNEYTKYGQYKLAGILKDKLLKQGHKPYVIPVGGSNWLGTWGYIQFFEELLQQIEQQDLKITDIVMACGSGSTSAGVALGAYLSKSGIKVTAYAVCDDEDYFYDYIDDLYKDLGVFELFDIKSSRQILDVVLAKGAGYAISKPEELDFISNLAKSTGIILDPVYNGKATKYLMDDISSDGDRWQNRSIIILHSGGLLGMYDKLPQVEQIQDLKDNIYRFQLQ